MKVFGRNLRNTDPVWVYGHIYYLWSIIDFQRAFQSFSACFYFHLLTFYIQLASLNFALYVV